MNGKLVAFTIIALLVGTGIGYLVSIPRILDLQRAYEQLEEVYEQLVKYFFIKDSNFTISLDENPYWEVEAWHENPDSICEIRDSILHLFYNGTLDDSYGNSGVFQGRHADGGSTQQLLVGDSPEDAFSGEYVIFPKNMQGDRFWLETNFRVIEMGFNRYPTVYHPDYSRVNLGVTLMCAINNEPFNLTAQTLWLDVYFAGYCLNTTDIWVVPKNWSYANYPDDIHAGYFVEEVHSQDFGKWITLQIDLGNYISKTLDLITEVDIKTIRVYGFIVFVECLGAYADVEYDYVKISLLH